MKKQHFYIRWAIFVVLFTVMAGFIISINDIDDGITETISFAVQVFLFVLLVIMVAIVFIEEEYKWKKFLKEQEKP